MTGLIKRELARPLAAALEDMPVVVLTGMRQAGKTTLLQHEKALTRRRYVTLDDYASLEEARRDPERFVGGEEPLTIDEAQRVPDLLLAVKRAVDRGRRPGQFVLSGSANFALLRNVSESLAGRALYMSLHPLSRRELARAIDSVPFLRRIFEDPKVPRHAELSPVTPAEVLRGGMPVPALGLVRDRGAWFRGYEQTYLERDVRELTQVADLVAFRTFVRLAAYRTGQILNATEVGRDARVTGQTVSRWLGVLEASYLASRVPPFMSNRTSRLMKSPKLYWADSGLAAHLWGLESAEALSKDKGWGALLETHVAQNLQAILSAAWPSATMSYWNVQGRHEVDFVIESGRDCVAIEVKSAARWDERDLRGLEAFLEATPRCRAAILAHQGRSSASLGERLFAIPIAHLLT